MPTFHSSGKTEFERIAGNENRYARHAMERAANETPMKSKKNARQRHAITSKPGQGSNCQTRQERVDQVNQKRKKTSSRPENCGKLSESHF